MSVPVSIEELGRQLAPFGSWPYIITMSDDARPHAVSVEVAWANGRFTASGGRSTTRNAAAHPDAVTLLWAPFEPGGYSLIVDVQARASDDGLTLTPVTAVLHRTGPAPAVEAPAGSCGNDCVRI
jgi:hypothetical protein